MKLIEKSPASHHLIEELSERETAVRRVTRVPLEVIIRTSRRVYGKTFRRVEGTPL
jgi:phosphoribosylaminoimidazole-succinocarboxamide synthase